MNTLRKISQAQFKLKLKESDVERTEATICFHILAIYLMKLNLSSLNKISRAA